MADEEKKDGKKPAWKLFPFWSRGREYIRKTTGLQLKDQKEEGFQITELDVYKHLAKRVNFKTLQRMNNVMWQVEKQWEGVEGDTNSKQNSADGMWGKALDLYSKGLDSSDKFKESIGPFRDPTMLQAEVRATSDGTGFSPRAHINVEIAGEKVRFPYHLPDEKKFRHGNWEYQLAFFGSSNPAYWNSIERDINKICEKTKEIVLSKETDPVRKVKISRNIDLYQETYVKFMENLKGWSIKFENDTHFNNIGGGSGVYNLMLQDTTNLRGRILSEFRLKSNEVFYTHSYKVIKPYILEEIDDRMITLVQENGEIAIENVKLNEMIFFNIHENPYTVELAKKVTEISELERHGNQGTMRQALSNLSAQITEFDEQIGGLIRVELTKRDFAGEIVSQIYRIQGVKVRDPLLEIKILTEEVLFILASLLLKAKSTDDAFILRGRKVRNLKELVQILRVIDEETFQHHVNENKNDFGNWILNTLEEKELANKVYEVLTRDNLISTLNERLSITEAQFQQKVEELFALIKRKLTELGLASTDRINELETLKRQLQRKSAGTNEAEVREKINILKEVFFTIYKQENENSIIKSYLASVKSKLLEVYNDIKTGLIELTNEPLENINTKLATILLRAGNRLSAIGEKEDQVEKYKQFIQTEFYKILEIEGIRALLNQHSELLTKRREIFGTYESLVRASFRHDQLERFLEKLVPKNPNFEQLEIEQGWGDDEHGFPLEIADGVTQFKDYVPALGDVLLDHFNNRSVRKIDPRFVGDSDLLDLASWVYCNYDAFRDDMRDGRYHKSSMSIMEHIMTDLNTQILNRIKRKRFGPATLDWWGFFENPNFDADFAKRKHAKVKVKLNKLHPFERNEGLRTETDPKEIVWTIEPSHLNPAFDPSISDVSIHMGRKYYYEGQGNTVQSNQPTMTTRGAALYIMHKVIDQTKKWSECMELFEKIASETDGYDIGPNLGGPSLKRWGKPLTKDIFDPGRSG